jgi:hypothetical protein
MLGGGSISFVLYLLENYEKEKKKEGYWEGQEK